MAQHPALPLGEVPLYAYSLDDVIRTRQIGARTKVLEFAKSGELRTFLIGNKRFVSDEALREFIRKREAEELANRAAA